MKVVDSSPRIRRSKYVATVVSLALVFFLLVSSQPACVLTTETIYTRPVYMGYTCKAVLMDTSTGELRGVNTRLLATDAPGAAARIILGYDYDRNGNYNVSDALLDFRRYLRNNIVSSSTFAGRSWCVRQSFTTCADPVSYVWRSTTPPEALPDAELPACFESTGPQLEVSAPGLTADNQFGFPDTAIGTTGTATSFFTVTNRSSVALRVNAINFMAGGDAPDFVKSSDSCAPTAAERMAGRGHLLGAGEICTFQVEFLPQHRDGLSECMAGSANESCRRRVVLSVTGETDANRSVVNPVNVSMSGRRYR